MTNGDETDLWPHALAFVLRHEGGFSDDPVDPGGTTHYGISLRYLRGLGVHLGDIDGDGDVDADDIRALTRADAAAIYKRDWWDRYLYADLPAPVAVKVFDLAVNMGANQAHKILQRAVNRLHPSAPVLKIDGVLGPATRAAAVACKPAELLDALRTEAANFYLLLIAAKPALARFRRGWLRRAAA